MAKIVAVDCATQQLKTAKAAASLNKMELPQEIMDMIIGFTTAKSDLSTLSRCSRRLHRVAIQHLYRSIEIRERPLSNAESKIPEPQGPNDPFDKIRNSDDAILPQRTLDFPRYRWSALIQFVLLFEDRSDLACLVEHLRIAASGDAQDSDFIEYTDYESLVEMAYKDEIAMRLGTWIDEWSLWSGDKTEWLRTLRGSEYDNALLAVLLSCLPNMKYLDLDVVSNRCIHFDSQIARIFDLAARMDPEPIAFQKLSSLTIRGEMSEFEGVSVSLMMQILSSLQFLPSLTRLRIKNVNMMNANISFPLPSTLQHLTIDTCDDHDPLGHVAAILSCSPPLSSFRALPRGEWRAESWQISNEPKRNLGPLSKALLAHKDTLEALDIHIASDKDRERKCGPTPDLRSLTILKRLHLGSRSLNGSMFWELQDCTRFLPPSVQEIAIWDFFGFGDVTGDIAVGLLKSKKLQLPEWNTLILHRAFAPQTHEEEVYSAIVRAAPGIGLKVAIVGDRPEGDLELIHCSDDELGKTWWKSMEA